MSVKTEKWIVHSLLLALALIIAVVTVIPTLNMFSTALKSQTEVFVFPPKLIPNVLAWSNFKRLFAMYDFGTWYSNSLFIAVTSSLATVLSSPFIAFGFARYKTRGKAAMFNFLLATMMLPYPVVMIPQFILFRNLGWVDTFLPIIVPNFFGSAYMIFLIRQYYTSLSAELFEASRIDGASEFRQWWSMALPLSGPVIATVAIFSFLGSWNDLLGQVLYLNSSTKFTLTVGMTSMYASATRLVPWNLVMVAAILSLLPILLLFAFSQKYFVQSIVSTGVK